MLIAQITDTHIKTQGRRAYGVVDTEQMLRECVRTLQALDPQPELIVFTGDLVDFGTPDEYACLRNILAPLKQKLLLVPGNHDERSALRAAFAEHHWLPGKGFLHYAVDIGPLRIIGLDTLIPGEGGGELCAERLAWLEATLAAAPTAPSLILMHHPPFATGIAHMDAIGLRGREAFSRLIEHHRQVRLILCGHLHRNIQTLVGGCRALTCPSPAHQVALDLRPDGPSCFRMEPPGFMLHRWDGENFLTHSVCIGSFPGPFPFFDPSGRLLD